jgi:hypothetical protein
MSKPLALYIPSRGTKNAIAFRQAVKRTAGGRQDVLMILRNTGVYVTDGDTPDMVKHAYTFARAAKKVEKRETQAADKARRKIRQKDMDEWVGGLDASPARGMLPLLGWMEEYAHLAGGPRVDAKAAAVLAKLAQAGYTPADAELQPGRDPTLYSRKVAGTVMGALTRVGKPPTYAAVSGWVSRYEKLLKAFISPSVP